MQCQMQSPPAVIIVAKDTLSLLPDEVLVRIFSYLIPTYVCLNVSLTCKRLGDVIRGHNRFIWSHIRLPKEMGSAAAFQCIQLSCSSLRWLEVETRHDDDEWNAIVVTALQKCTGLQALQIMHGNSKDKPTLKSGTVRSIGEWGKSLRKLNLCLDGGTMMALQSGDVANFRNLTSFQAPTDFCEEQLKLVADHCKKIQVLKLEAGSISETGLSYCLERVCGTLRQLRTRHYAYDKESLGWIQKCNRLEILELGEICRWDTAAFTSLSKMPKLRTLYLDFLGCDGTTDGAKNLFLDGGMKDLCKLFLGSCNSLTQVDLDTIAREGLNLIHLCLSSAPEQLSIKSVLISCKELRYLSVYGLVRKTSNKRRRH